MTSLLFYQTGFAKMLRSPILINDPLCYSEYRMNFKQKLYLTTLLLKNSKEEEVLGIIIDSKLDFSTHRASITNFFCKASV